MLNRKAVFLILFALSGALFSCNNDENLKIKETPCYGCSKDIYQNQYLPQDFGLLLPLYRSRTKEVDMNKCYVDEMPSSGEISDQVARLCGMQFEQAKIELHALMLDLALPRIRALCRNNLSDCDLEDQEVFITISEPVIRRIEQLHQFYEYVGMEDYFYYNDYELKNGAKIPYYIYKYQESNHPVYEYAAYVHTNVLSTQGSDVEERKDQGQIIIYWNKCRHNILMEWHTLVDVFIYTVNARRVFEFNLNKSDLRYTSQLMFWSETNSFRYNHALAIESCGNSRNDKCAGFYDLGGRFHGFDADFDGFYPEDISSPDIRSTKGYVTPEGGIVENYYPEQNTGVKEQIIFNSSASEIFHLEAAALSNDWQFAGTSPSADWDLLAGTPLYSENVDENGMLVLSLHGRLLTEEVPSIQNKSSYWISTDTPSNPYTINGLGLKGLSKSIFLDWSGVSETGNLFNAVYLMDGRQVYNSAGSPGDLILLLY